MKMLKILAICASGSAMILAIILFVKSFSTGNIQMITAKIPAVLITIFLLREAIKNEKLIK